MDENDGPGEGDELGKSAACRADGGGVSCIYSENYNISNTMNSQTPAACGGRGVIGDRSE